MPDTTPQRLAAITVYGDRAAAALQQVTSLLDSAGVAAEETQELLALIQAGAIERAQGDVLELAEHPPGSSTAPAVQGWVDAVRAAAAELEAPHEQAQQVLAAAERIFAELTGRSDYSREASLETLAVVLTAVTAEDQAGYITQLEDFATRNRGRLAELYRKYGPGGELAKLERSGLIEQPESIVICERLDAAPMLLQGVWDGELEESTLERFTQLWRFGCNTPRGAQPVKAR
ncbi:hypothetical protein [Streptomyces sp. NPDC057375]|uniref:hypothetical protein n=1 Tax=Streptomyces sp. NPDC057375 TaxID=3346109 RepID=UPI00362B2767